MSIRTKNLINKTFANSADASVFFSERNSFGKTFQFLYQLETEPDNVYYIDETVDNPILLTGGGGGNDFVFSNDEIFFSQKFITSTELDIDGNYTIVADDIDKLLIFYVDRELYPTFKVKIPEDIPEYVFDFETHIPKIRFLFFDGGVYQTHYQSYFIQPNTLRESGTGNTTAETRTFYVFKDELNDVVLYNASEDSLFGSVDENEATTGYTDQYVNFTNSLQGLGSFTVIEDGDTIQVKNGWNLIGSHFEGIQPPIDNITFNITKQKHLLGADINIHCLCQITNVTFNGVSSELVSVPTIIEKGSTLTFRKVQFPGEFGGIDDMVILISEPKKEMILDLGRITFADINTATATSSIEISLGVTYPNTYIERLFVEVENDFDFTINTSILQIASIGISENLSLTTINKKLFNIGASNDHLAGVNDTKLVIDFNVGGGEVNPQNLTRGILKVKALIKQFPI